MVAQYIVSIITHYHASNMPALFSDCTLRERHRYLAILIYKTLENSYNNTHQGRFATWRQSRWWRRRHTPYISVAPSRDSPCRRAERSGSVSKDPTGRPRRAGRSDQFLAVNGTPRQSYKKISPNSLGWSDPGKMYNVNQMKRSSPKGVFAIPNKMCLQCLFDCCCFKP